MLVVVVGVGVGVLAWFRVVMVEALLAMVMAVTAVTCWLVGCLLNVPATC